MKILIVSFTFPPNKDGVSDAASAMVLGFVERGWRVDVLTETTAAGREPLDWRGSRIREFSYSADSPPEIRIQGCGTSYEDFLIAGGWDVIIIHAYEYPMRRALPVLEKIPGKKILVSHGYAALIWNRVPKFPYGLGVWLRSAMASSKMPFWLPRFDRAVYLSEQADFHGFYDHLIAKGIGYWGRRVIPNGVDPDEGGENPADFRTRHGIAGEAFLFLCVANYSVRKDQGYGARAFRRAAIPGSVLVFIGSEFNESSRVFQAEDAADNAPGKIIWLERQSRESTLDALAACDTFLLSAKHEAQPISILEAMREGKPWVARKAGCIPSLEGGLCVKSVSAMAAAMIELAGDPSLRASLSELGRRAVATRYNRKAYVDSYCKLVEELLTETTSQPG